jgi:hypothetical protein
MKPLVVAASWSLSLVLGLPLARADTLPARTPGLWEVSIAAAGQSVMRQQKVLQCTTPQVDAVTLLAVVPGQEHCHETRVKKGANGTRFDVQTVCFVHDNRVTARIQLSGDFQQSYQGQFEVSYSRPVAHGSAGVTQFSGRRLGDCRPGMKPSDMVLPNGVTVNIVDSLKQREGHGGHAH